MLTVASVQLECIAAVKKISKISRKCRWKVWKLRGTGFIFLFFFFFPPTAQKTNGELDSTGFVQRGYEKYGIELAKGNFLLRRLFRTWIVLLLGRWTSNVYSPYVGWKYRFHLPVSGLRSLSLYRTLQFFARFHRGTQVRKVYLRSTVTRRRIDTCGKGISFRNNQFGSNKRLIVAISSCIENKRVSFNAMLLGITRLQPELSADHSETFHLCYRIFRWIIANFTRWNTKLRRNISIASEYVDFLFLFFFYSSLSSSLLHCFPSRLVQPFLPSAFPSFSIFAPLKSPFPPRFLRLSESWFVETAKKRLFVFSLIRSNGGT